MLHHSQLALTSAGHVDALHLRSHFRLRLSVPPSRVCFCSSTPLGDACSGRPGPVGADELPTHVLRSRRIKPPMATLVFLPTTWPCHDPLQPCCLHPYCLHPAGPVLLWAVRIVRCLTPEQPRQSPVADLIDQRGPCASRITVELDGMVPPSPQSNETGGP
jgi:hypothetical protein